MKNVVHFEIPADNLDRARQFYSIFDWDLQDWPMPDGSPYIGASTVEVDEQTRVPLKPGAINGGITQRDSNLQSPAFAINVPSVDEFSDKVVAAGGSIVKPKYNVMDMGFFAYVKDTEGNVFGLWEDIPRGDGAE